MARRSNRVYQVAVAEAENSEDADFKQNVVSAAEALQGRKYSFLCITLD